MRGKHSRTRVDNYGVRIIPAHAGQTEIVPRWIKAHADHPRACGANVFVFGPCRQSVGSSPRMRGKR